VLRRCTQSLLPPGLLLLARFYDFAGAEASFKFDQFIVDEPDLYFFDA